MTTDINSFLVSKDFKSIGFLTSCVSILFASIDSLFGVISVKVLGVLLFEVWSNDDLCAFNSRLLLFWVDGSAQHHKAN